MKESPKKSIYDWLKSIEGWQKSVVATIVTSFVIWLAVYIKDNISSPADVRKINAVQAQVADKTTKDSIFSLNTLEQLHTLDVKTTITDQKVSAIQEDVKTQKEILVKILFVMNDVKKTVDYNKTYTAK